MPFDPEDIMGATGATQDPGKGSKPSSGFNVSDIHTAAQSSSVNPTGKQDLISGTIDPNTQFSEFRFQPKTNGNNYLLRAQDQGFWESLGKTIGNTVANVPIDIIQGIGYLGTLLETGDDRDYTNALTEQMEKLKSPLGQVYQEHPNDYFDLSDSAWWMNNLGQLAESAGSFAIEGAGIARIFGTAAKAAAWSARTAKIGSQVAQGLSAATLTYMEGAMSGANVFETAYNNNYMKMIGQGIDPNEADQQAKHIASQAAAATVQLHTAMNLALNATGLTPLFRDPEQSIVRWWRKNGAKLPGESAAQWTARIEAAAPEGMPLKKLLGLGMEGPTRLGLEAFQEGLEEVNTQYAEHVGKAIGEGKEEKDVAGRLLDADRYFSEVLNQEGALNMALGALGGIAQTVLLDHIPVHKVIKYGPDGKPLLIEQGQPQTERISSHTLNNRMNRQYFDNIKDALSADMKWFGEKSEEMEKALTSKDLATLARVRADMMSVHNLRAISLGLGDVWKQQYQDIMSLDNTGGPGEKLQPQLEEITNQMQEAFNSGDTDTANQLNTRRMQLLDQQQSLMDVTNAMQKGFAESKNDNSYKERAQQAIQNLDYLTDLYNDMQDKFTGTPELEQSGLAEHMFYRQANLYLHKQQLDMMEQDLIKLRTRIDQMTLSGQDDILVKQTQQFLADKEVWDNTVKKLNNDISRLNDAIKNQDENVLLKLLAKYKIPATKDAGKRLIETLERRKKELQDRAEYTNKEIEDTVAVWKETNPGKEVKDVLQKASERPALEDIYQQNKAYLQQGITEYETAREQLSKDSTNQGIQQFLKENKPKSNKRELDKQHIEAYNQQLDREIAANMDAKQKQEATTKLDERITQVQNELSAKQVQLSGLRQQLGTLKGFFKNLSKRSDTKKAMQELESEVYSLKYELEHLSRRRDAMNGKAQQATTQAQNVERTPAGPKLDPRVKRTTRTATANDLVPSVPGVTMEDMQALADKYGDKFNPVNVQTDLQLTPIAATNVFQAYLEKVSPQYTSQFNNELPDFDFSQEVTPTFTTVDESNPVFDQLVGGSEAGATLRQFIQIRKTSSVEFLVGAVKSMIQKTNLPMPSQTEFDQFITPYVTALKQQYESQKPNAEQAYEGLKAFLKQDVLTVLDILEGEFRQYGFSYDRAFQVLNDQVKAKNLEKNMVGLVANHLKDYLQFTEQPIVEEQQSVPTQIDNREEQRQKELDENAYRIQDKVELWEAENPDTGKTERFYITTYKDGKRELKKIDGSGKPIVTIATQIEPGVDINKILPADNWRKVEDVTDFSNKVLDVINEKYSTKPFNEEPTTYIPPTPDSEPTIFSNNALNLETVQQDQKRFVGASNIEVVKANFNTNPYKEFDTGSKIKIVADYTELDSKLNTDVLIPGIINAGDDVTFIVDEDWSGEINYDTEMMQDEYGEQLRRADMFQNYLESPGKIGTISSAQHPKGAHANVPIKIIHNTTGKTIGYLPRADWVLAKYPDTGNYRNVVDEYKDGDINVTDNVARQYGRIMKLRENIVRAWNTDKNLKLTSKVSSRGDGHVMLNREVNPNTGTTKLVNRSAKNMLPDPSLEIAIMKQGTAYVGAGTTSEKPVGKMPAYLQDATSLPVAMLPSPSGKFIPTPLYTHQLGDSPGTLNTMVSAITMYLRAAAGTSTASDLKNLQRIRDEVGFDLTVPGDLRDFIQQYFTFTQKFGEKDTVITPSEVSSGAISQFMLDIPDLIPGEKVAFIKAGTSFSGEKPIYAQLINGELHPDFEDVLRNGLKDRFKNVIFAGKNLRGVNSQGEFKAPIIRKDGVVQITAYKDYNEYVKANSVTFAYGLNKVGDQYVYMANPVVQLDYDQALKSAPPVINTNLPQQQPGVSTTEDEQLEEPDELADLFGNGILSSSPGSVTPLQIPNQGEQVSLELLQNLRNLTPEAHRNSRSPEEVLRELLERGVTVLAEGHNPFYIC